MNKQEKLYKEELIIKYQILNDLLKGSIKTFKNMEEFLDKLAYYFLNKGSENLTIYKINTYLTDNNLNEKKETNVFSKIITNIFYSTFNKFKEDFLNLKNKIEKYEEKKNLSIEEKKELEFLKNKYKEKITLYTNELFEKDYEHVKKTFNLNNRNEILLQMAKFKNIDIKNKTNYYLLETLIKNNIKDNIPKYIQGNNYFNVHQTFDILNTSSQRNKLILPLYKDFFIYTSNYIYNNYIERPMYNNKKYKNFKNANVNNLLFKTNFELKPYENEEQYMKIKKELKNNLANFIKHFNITNINLINSFLESLNFKNIEIDNKIELPKYEEETNINVKKPYYFNIKLNSNFINFENDKIKIIFNNKHNGINIELSGSNYIDRNPSINKYKISKKNIDIYLDLNDLKNKLLQNIDKIIKSNYTSFNKIIGFKKYSEYNKELKDLYNVISNNRYDKERLYEEINKMPEKIIKLNINTPEEKQSIIKQIEKDNKNKQILNVNGLNIDINTIFSNISEIKLLQKIEEEREKERIMLKIKEEEQTLKEDENFYKSKIKNKNIPYKVLSNGFVIEGNIETNKIKQIENLLKNYDKYYNYKDGEAYYEGEKQNKEIKQELEKLLKNNNVTIYEIYNLYQSSEKDIKKIIEVKENKEELQNFL